MCKVCLLTSSRLVVGSSFQDFMIIQPAHFPTALGNKVKFYYSLMQVLDCYDSVVV